MQRQVVLREERFAGGSRHLWAYLSPDGALHVDGQDLGQGTELVSGDGEYEWFQAIAADQVPALIAALGGSSDDDVLDLLQRRYCGDASYQLEEVLRSGVVVVQRYVWSS